jgi:hypothetical protein
MSRLRSVHNAVAWVLIAAAAALEAAIEVQREIPEARVMISFTDRLHYAPAVLLMVVGCLWLYQAFLPSGTSIEILAPLDKEAVPRLREVRGSIWPPTAPLQVFVFADLLWHPQQLPTRDGASWCVQGHFETAAADADFEFKIAGISRSALVIGPVKRLPWWSTAKSNVVSVKRS